jgi:tellurite methyltransferase
LHRSIVGFHQDLEQHWVAELDCGHCQHTRHEPPFFPRSWVTTEIGRSEHLGQLLNCVLCDRQEIPNGYAPYRRTPLFTNHSIPKGLRARHTTKKGVWGIIHIQSGSLRYRIHDPYHTEIILVGGPSARRNRDRQGIVIPEVEHEVEPIDNVEFFVEFWDKT